MKLNTYAALEELVEENVPNGITRHGYFHKQILFMVQSAPGKDLNMSEEELVQIIQSLNYSHEASTPSDDDEYMYVTNSFTRKRWTYAANPGCSWGVAPTFVNKQ